MFFDETEHVEREFVFDRPLDPTALPGPGEHEPGAKVRVRLYGWLKAGGDIVWRGARLLSKELLQRGKCLHGMTALELGAGSGLPGSLAAHLGARAVITDGDEDFVPLMRKNVECFSDHLGLGGSLAAAHLEWGTAAAAAAEKDQREEMELFHRHSFDLIIGSEIVYMPEHIRELAETIGFFLSDAGEAIIVNTAVATRTSHPEARSRFLAGLEEEGLHVEEERGPDGPTFLAAGGSWSENAYLLRITRRH